MTKEIEKVENLDLSKYVPEGYEIEQVGELNNWVVFETTGDVSFLPEDWPADKPVIVEGILLSRESWEDEEGKTRYFFNIQLKRECPVNFKDEEGIVHAEIAQPGSIVALGDRAKMGVLHRLIDSGGSYQVFVAPSKKIKIGKGRKMWLFHVGKKVLREPRLPKVPF